VIIRDVRVEDRDLLAWISDVRRALTSTIEGLRWHDNVGELGRFRYLADRAPYDVSCAATERPLAVLVLQAQNLVDFSFETGCRIKWTWRRSSIRVESIDVTNTTDEYAVSLGLLMG
jgi:hypothetical protein